MNIGKVDILVMYITSTQTSNILDRVLTIVLEYIFALRFYYDSFYSLNFVSVLMILWFLWATQNLSVKDVVLEWFDLL